MNNDWVGTLAVLMVMFVIFSLGLTLGDSIRETKIKNMAIKEGFGHYSCDVNGNVSFIWGVNTNK